VRAADGEATVPSSKILFVTESNRAGGVEGQELLFVLVS
jgi:hypothetical protein